jgi:flavodoxin
MNKALKAIAAAAAIAAASAIPAQAKTLVIYFSQPEESDAGRGVDAVTGASALFRDGEVKGSNQYVAEIAARLTGGDMFRIETAKQYPVQHDPLVAQAKQEAESNTIPEIKALPDIKGYDKVVVGYPIWWYKMPMAVQGMFEKLDFSGKEIAPFAVHGGSGLGGTDDQIRKLEPKAKVVEGLAISRSDVDEDSVPGEVDSWLREIGYIR